MLLIKQHESTQLSVGQTVKVSSKKSAVNIFNFLPLWSEFNILPLTLQKTCYQY